MADTDPSDARPSRMQRRFAIRFALAGALLSVGAPGGLWVLMRVVEPAADAVMTWAYVYVAITTLVTFAAFGGFAGRLVDAVRQTALRDALTGLYNRRFLAASLPGTRAACRRRGTPLSLLMLDLDLFKRVNDSFGHDVGDQTLRAVARALAATVRESDVLARYGGEEFAVACPDTDARLATEVGERLRAAVAALDENALGHAGPQTISVGVATLAPDADDSIADLLHRADQALYRAKESGRNRVFVAAA